MDLGLEFVQVDVDRLAREEKKQKKKEKKRLKKEKKQKKTAKRSATPSSSSGSEGERLPEDAPPEAALAAKPERDEWLTAASTDRNILTGQRAEDRPEKESPKPEAAKVSAKELNPTLAPGGGDSKPTAAGQGVGDGGASWRLKALKRAQALAESEGRRVDDIVAERFGSLANLTQQLTTNRAAHSRAHLHAQRDRQRQRDDGEAADYLQDVGSGQGKMRRPDKSSASLSWRKNKAGREDSGRRREAEGRDSRRGEARDREPRDRDGDRAPEGQRRSRRDPLGRPEDAAAIRKAAAAINTFAGDGSFMAGFQAKAAEPAAASNEGKEGSPPGGEKSGPPAAQQPRVVEREGDAAPVTAGTDLDADNKSAAAALRARLMGSRAPSSGASAAAATGAKRTQVEILPSVDARGRALPGAHGRAAAGEGLADTERRPAKLQRFDGGERQRYFADDDARSLEDLVKEQRHGGGHDIDATLAHNIARKSGFRERDLDVDAEYDVDGGLEMYERRQRKGGREAAEKRERAARISNLRRTNRAQDACEFCLSSGKRPRHLTVAVAQTTYLFLPRRDRLAPLHCCIAPVEHVSSSREVDEHVWIEMRNFKKCVIRMFAAEGMHALFVETATRLGDLRSHAVVHCVPMDDAAFHKAPIVFRKALQEAESEWSQHHAKAVIDTAVKGLRGSIPPNFPYFFVEFGLSSGYLHPIDDEERFGGRDFGRGVLAGLLRLGPEVQHRGAAPEPLHRQQKLVDGFCAKFEPFDWTKQLE